MGEILKTVNNADNDWAAPPAYSVNTILPLAEVWFLIVIISPAFNSTRVRVDNWPAPLLVPWIV